MHSGVFCLTSAMFRFLRSLPSAFALIFFIFSLNLAAYAAAAKPHIVNFGKWIGVSYASIEDGAAKDPPMTLKIRPLLVDAHIKEFTFGTPHEVTDRLFVVPRIFRVNDSLPQETNAVPHWQWERGGWLLVDRVTGRISPLNLPDFDAVYSVASWYRDYAAYCGLSEDGKKIYAVVAQLGRRKPVLKKLLDSETKNGLERAEIKSITDAPCPLPAWQRAPARVTFEPARSPKETFAIRGHVVGVIVEDEDENQEAEK